MYHCGTKPVLMHIANGMYGAIVVDPATPARRRSTREYVLVASEWYLTTDGLTEPANRDLAKAHSISPDWTTFNGYAAQYVTHPLTADPGDTIRFYVVDAGPSLTTAFHVVGTIFDKAYIDRGHEPQHALEGVQTVDVPAGGGGVFEVTINYLGEYPVVKPFGRQCRPRTGRDPQGRQPVRVDVALRWLETPRADDRSLKTITVIPQAPALELSRGVFLAGPPPSTSGLGHYLFKVAARVRIPLGAFTAEPQRRGPPGAHALDERRSRLLSPTHEPLRDRER